MFSGPINQRAGWSEAHAISLPTLRASLRKAHHELEESIAALASVTGEGACPPSDVIARARWRLSAANRVRTKVSMEAVKALREFGDPTQASNLDLVSGLTDQIREFTQRYVQDWTPAAVLADWQGYRRASEEKREMLASSVELERAVLCGLLDRHRL